MDFFAQQDKVRGSSRRLVILFVLAVLAIVVAIDLIFVLAFGWVHMDAAANGPAPTNFSIDWIFMAKVSAVVVAVIGCASLYRLASLRSGGAKVALGMGATLVPADTSNPAWRRLRDVIEEVAIASGSPVPDIFVLEGEEGINAFAAGYTASDAAVCVTQGCLNHLNRDELQGVIAHEFSHVLNGDMRLNIRLMGLLFGVLMIGIIGRFMLFSGGRVRSREGNSGASFALIGIAVVAVGFIGVFFGRLIQAAVARSRESLADASAVQFTRQTQGIAGALKKIAALQAGSSLGGHRTQEVAHMLFGEPGRFSRLFATHPPLPERVRALGERWDDSEIEALARGWQASPSASADAPASAAVAGFASGVSAMAGMPADAPPPLPAHNASWSVPSGHVSAQVGQPDASHFAVAAQLREQLSPELTACTQQADKAQALLLALAMDADTEVHDAQLLHIDHVLGSHCAEAAEQAFGLLANMHPMQRLPLASMALPALRRCPRPQLDALMDMLGDLVRVDDRVDLHEYCMVRLLQLQLHDVLDPAAGFRPGNRRLHRLEEDFATLCAIVAAHGHEDTEAAQRAWAAAIDQALPGYHGHCEVAAQWQSALDTALHNLDRLRAFDKKMVVDALTTVVGNDGVITVAEAELVRVICAALHCPVPPLGVTSNA